MNSVGICIPTYKRPQMLEGLLTSILNCQLQESFIREVTIIVIDNDSERSAEQVTMKFKNCASHFKISYLSFPVKGLAYIRNELIKRALETTANFIVFIDDDEFVTGGWLTSLVKTAILNGADAVRGPVLVDFKEEVPKYIKYWFKREQYADNEQLFSLTTGNLLLNRESLEMFNVWFDHRFNACGSEDSYFGSQLLKKGARLYWSANAITYETIPRSRASLKWLVRRIYRTASTYSYMLKIENEYLKLIKKGVISVLYLVSGFLALPMVLSKIDRKHWGVLKIAEGAGGIAGILNITYKEYAK